MVQEGLRKKVSTSLHVSNAPLFYREIPNLAYHGRNGTYIIEDNIQKIVSGEIELPAESIPDSKVVIPQCLVVDTIEEGTVARRVDCSWIIVQDPILMILLTLLTERMLREPDNPYRVGDLIFDVIDYISPKDVGLNNREELHNLIKKYIRLSNYLALIVFAKIEPVNYKR